MAERPAETAGTGFRQIARAAHLPTRIAKEIVRTIAERGLGAGERLPTEQVLSNAFGVSRSVVREAIAKLRNEGVVETRQGVGAFVTDPQRRATIRIEQASLADPASLRSFFQLRLPLEIEAARLAARHRTQRDLDQLRAALDDMIHAKDWMDRGVKGDLAFHRALAAATQNEYFTIFLGFVAEKISLTIDTAFSRATGTDIVRITIDEHAAIHEAVAAGDAPGAATAMQRHLVQAAARLQIVVETP